jgi:hypothetical protein
VAAAAAGGGVCIVIDTPSLGGRAGEYSINTTSYTM